MKRISDYSFILILILIFINLFTISNIKEIIMDSCSIWLNNLIPSIFPFYIISDLLINYGFINVLNLVFKNFFYKLFKISEGSIFVLIFSMLTGFPSSAKYIKSLIKENLINASEANNIIRFCHFSNPLFVINIIGLNILGSKKLGFLILISHFIANFVIAFIFKSDNTTNKTKINLTSEKLSVVLTNSILNTFNSLLIILGNIIVFKLLIEIIFKHFYFNSMINAIINIILEITTGILRLNSLNISTNIKAIIITSAISFGGLCVHSQVYGILSDTKVKYKNYLIGRIIQAIIAPIILMMLNSI